jgi:hypothetical protein
MSPAAGTASGGSPAACGGNGWPVPLGFEVPGETFHSLIQLPDPSGSRAAEMSASCAP